MADFTALEDQIRECYGRVIYTHKTHEKMADICSDTLRCYKISQIVVSGLTTTGALAIIFSDKLWLKGATALLSFAALWITGYTKNFDLGETSQKHRDAAASIWPIRESYLSLLTDLREKRITDEEATSRRDSLQVKLAAVYKGAPQTNSKAYTEAQKALKENEEYTFSEAELDIFVPTSLRKNP